jgi:hypothetical protein
MLQDNPANSVTDTSMADGHVAADKKTRASNNTKVRDAAFNVSIMPIDE